MHHETFFFCLVLFCAAMVLNILSQETTAAKALPVQYEELTAPQFVTALSKAENVCLIPIGIMEKHGPHLPLGTDLLDCREVALRAAKKEYCVVFPEYYFGQIYEAKHQPGTIAYSADLVWRVLQETCDELARNGFKKIILVNGHGGNNYFLPYFCQSQLANPRDYAVILFRPEDDPVLEEKVKKLRKTTTGGHACEVETSMLFSHRPDLVHPDQAQTQSGESLNRLSELKYGYTGIWWYANYPNHYAGDGTYASREIGDLVINGEADQLIKLIQIVKKDKNILELQQKFYNEGKNPLNTKQ